jgi:two-component system nitrate/nitrite response regulator NarL
MQWQWLNWMEPMTKELSVRETQILRLIAEGKENREIAQVLGISVRTVEAHRARIMLKLDLESVTGLVRYAVRNGIIEA